MPPPTLFLAEHAAVTTGEDPVTTPFGTIYPEPYDAPLRMWSFSARVIEALADAFWEPTRGGPQLNLVLTPALDDGEARVTRDDESYREVFVGLSPPRWLAASVADKRRILLESCVTQLTAVADAWSLDARVLASRARELVDTYRFDGVIGDPSPIALDDELARQLDFASWRTTRGPERLAIARAVIDRLRASGRPLGDPQLVTSAGGEPVVRASLGGVGFVLVPSGRMRRGFDSAQLAAIDRIFEQIWRFKSEPDAERSMPRALAPFGADGSCQLDAEGDVTISPLWMAETSSEIYEAPPPWASDRPPTDGPKFVTWQRTLAYLAEHRLALPSSDELLWAASAGDARLFPWGDDATPIGHLLDAGAEALASMYGANHERRTPRFLFDPFEMFAETNPFGVAAALSHATWAMPSDAPDDPTPLVIVGGALDFHPWQGGWEAMLFLTRMVSRIAFDGRVGAPRATVRPVIRLLP